MHAAVVKAVTAREHTQREEVQAATMTSQHDAPSGLLNTAWVGDAKETGAEVKEEGPVGTPGGGGGDGGGGEGGVLGEIGAVREGGEAVRPGGCTPEETSPVQVRIQMTSSQTSRLEALKVAVVIQKDVLGLAEAGCLQHLRRAVEERPGTGGNTPTLAEQTRYVRLQAVVNVLTEVVALELNVISWIEGLPTSVPSDLLSDLQQTLADIEKATSGMPDEWDALQDTPEMVETLIARLHTSVEGVLNALGQLVTGVMHNDLSVTSTEPCGVTLSDLSLLYLKLPQAYLHEK